ncbi:GIY-YIG nuclease family protein [Streptomyces sp. NPDC015346]|uniref:GIY-YIG nuclease family protein n=1 Tax=Streptomyces sp. NPDC015346 TaxID=3364954 RepID=UPI0036FB4401
MTAFVYVIGEQGSRIVKIGTTKDLSLRLTALQTGNPNPLVLLWSHQGGRDLEGHLHATFAPHRVRGEWFDLNPLGEPVAAVQRAVEAAGLGLLPRPRREAIPVSGRPDETAGTASDDGHWWLSLKLDNLFRAREHFTLQEAAEALEKPLHFVEHYAAKAEAKNLLIRRRALSSRGEPLFAVPWDSYLPCSGEDW